MKTLAGGHDISVPAIPARRDVDRWEADDVTCVISREICTPADVVEALGIGAEAIAVSNAASQAIGSFGMRASHANARPLGIATQGLHLRTRLPDELAAQRQEP